MAVRISTETLGQVLAHAAATPDREVCGLLLGRAGRIEAAIPAENVHPEPATRFEVDPEIHFAALRAARAGGPAVLGPYHSHPSGIPVPSVTDAAMALDPGQLWLIVGESGVRLWEVSRPGTFLEVALDIVAPGCCTLVTEPPQGPARTRDGP